VDGKGRWIGNVFIELLWRSLKYECVYLNAFDNMQEAKEKLNTWIDYCNLERAHTSLNDQTQNEVYEGFEPLSLAAIMILLDSTLRSLPRCPTNGVTSVLTFELTGFYEA